MEMTVSLIWGCCNMDTRGGRVHVWPDLCTCLVYDVAKIPDALLTKLKTMHARVDVLADTCSLSGFVVRVRIRNTSNSRVVVIGAAMACMGAVVLHCLRRDI